MGHGWTGRIRSSALTFLRRHAHDNALLQRKPPTALSQASQPFPSVPSPSPSPRSALGLLNFHLLFPPSTDPASQVDSPDSLENVESKWVGEIAENCAGVKLVLVALKCDLREKHSDEDDEEEDSTVANGTATAGTTRRQGPKDCIDYKQGLEVARRIQALRYLGK